MRPPRLHHCTSEPLHFQGRAAELELLNRALGDNEVSVVAFVGPGGQGKTAIVQHWLQSASCFENVDGIFLWSFYRGKDSDLCLREMLAYAEGAFAQVSASFCVDRLLPILRKERWAIVLDGTEVVQHEAGAWFGRFVHPELGRLVDELASAPMPGVLLLTSRFAFPTLATRRFAKTVGLSTLDAATARGLLMSLGVKGMDPELAEAAEVAGHHAKAVELLGTWICRFHDGVARNAQFLPPRQARDGTTDEEASVTHVLSGFHQDLSEELRDIVALSTAFRSPPTEARLLEYLGSPSVHHLVHETWGRTYAPFSKREAGWLARQIQALVDLRLLERVSEPPVIDAHPLVRAGFESPHGEHGARTRAGFLRGRPDRRPPASLEEARDEVELFHSYCDAGLWNEADSIYVALDNPKHRFLAPAFERDLLVRFFPNADWRQPPLWPGFGRHRSLAICFELMGQFEDALECYRGTDAALRGDALIALGRLQPLVEQTQAASPWQNLWQAYRAHALCLAGKTEQALGVARSLIPIDVYEWIHVFECLLRAGALDAMDLRSLLYRPPLENEHPWSILARRRMRADHVRLMEPHSISDLGAEYREILDAYDRGGLPFERALTRLSYCRWLISKGERGEATKWNEQTIELSRRHRMRIVEIDALELAGEPSAKAGEACGYAGPARP